MTKIAILIDGGYLREVTKKQRYYYNEEFIEKMIFSIPQRDEQLFRVLYYDCNRYQGKVILPVSGRPHEYKANRLAPKKDFLAVITAYIPTEDEWEQDLRTRRPK